MMMLFIQLSILKCYLANPSAIKQIGLKTKLCLIHSFP